VHHRLLKHVDDCILTTHNHSVFGKVVLEQPLPRKAVPYQRTCHISGTTSDQQVFDTFYTQSPLQ